MDDTTAVIDALVDTLTVTTCDETVALAVLRPHPRNYRSHPPEQLRHIQKNIQDYGIYRNIVIARDSTILAGHGVVAAARALGYTHLPIKRLDLDPDDPRALKLLVADNGISHLAIDDDRLLTDTLRDLHRLDPALLLGTGYDATALADLAFITRPEHELRTPGAAAEWVGAPTPSPTPKSSNSS
jgi:hypothetical protein